VYEEALKKIKKKRYYAARDLLLTLQTRVPQDDRDLMPKVQLTLADSYYLDGGILNLSEALGAYRTFLTYYPQRAEAAYAQYQVGMCYFGQVLAPDRDQELTFRAMIEFEKVERLYPDSPHVNQAQARLKDCQERLAAHEFTIGQFYYKRKFFLAATNRFRLILDQYPSFDRIDETLYLLAASLYRIDNAAEGRLHVVRLLQEFPGSKFARKGRQLAENEEMRAQKEKEKRDEKARKKKKKIEKQDEE
jgi:outer membrane protein assembly factor BamD